MELLSSESKSFALDIFYDIRSAVEKLIWSVFLVSGFLISCDTDDYSELTKKEIDEPNKTSSPNSGSRSGIEEINLLENGGLEEWSSFWTPEMPKGWSLPSNNFVRQDKKIVYEGRSSAKMESEESGQTARLEQNIQVPPQGKIRIRFHYYVEKWKSKGARTYCYFRTREAEASNLSIDELKDFYDDDIYYIIRGGGYGLTYFPHDLNVWQVFDETIEVPPTATYFSFGINSYKGTTIYVDDCWVIDVTEHPTTGMNPVKM